MSLCIVLIYGSLLVYFFANLVTELRKAKLHSSIKVGKTRNDDERRSFQAQAVKIPYTNLTATLDEESILCAKMLVTHPVYGTPEHRAQNAVIAKIVQDLIKFLNGFSIATCPYRACKIAAELTQYQVEKDWFDLARYWGGYPSKDLILPPFSIFIASVYYSVSNMERIELASGFANSPPLRNAASIYLSEILDAIEGMNVEGMN